MVKNESAEAENTTGPCYGWSCSSLNVNATEKYQNCLQLTGIDGVVFQIVPLALEFWENREQHCVRERGREKSLHFVKLGSYLAGRPQVCSSLWAGLTLRQKRQRDWYISWLNNECMWAASPLSRPYCRSHSAAAWSPWSAPQSPAAALSGWHSSSAAVAPDDPHPPGSGPVVFAHLLVEIFISKPASNSCMDIISKASMCKVITV